MKNKFSNKLLMVIGLVSILAISCKKEEDIPKINEIQFNPTLKYGTVSDVDDNIYKTISIGQQVWMAENLRTTRYKDGSPITNHKLVNTWSSLRSEAYCWNNNDANNKDTYGAIYNYYAVADRRNLCPDGWHVPSMIDWLFLQDLLGGYEVAGGHLKENEFSHWMEPNTGADNSSGFTALPAGGCGFTDDFDVHGYRAYYWSSNEYNNKYAYGCYLKSSNSILELGYGDKFLGLYVRCKKDGAYIITYEVHNILQTSAICGGNVFSEDASIILKGVCWSTSANPTIDLSTRTEDGADNGEYVSTITGLIPNTKYYVRAYAKTSTETIYGNEIIFITPAVSLPTISTVPINTITNQTAKSGGDISNDGGLTITARGVCWSTSANPTLDLTTKTIDGAGSGSFVSSINGLSANTTYHIRAYATNSLGTTYGNEWVATTYYTTVIDVDGNICNAIDIGTQIWMIENLKTTKYSNGDPIPNIVSNDEWKVQTKGAYCWYNNDINIKNIYGALYNGYTIVDSRKLCPTGWHVPTTNDWEVLTVYLGGENVAGGKMKEIAGWNYPNTGANNSSRFSGLPAGERSSSGEFKNMGSYTSFWSILYYPQSYLLFDIDLSYSDASNNDHYSPGDDCGISVRCLKDQ